MEQQTDKETIETLIITNNLDDGRPKISHPECYKTAENDRDYPL